MDVTKTPVFVPNEPNQRMCGPMNNSEHSHVIPKDAIMAWAANPDYHVQTLCGVLFRPTWIGISSTSEPCPTCKPLTTEVKLWEDR